MPRAVKTLCAAGWRGLVPWPVDFPSGDPALLAWDFTERLRRVTLAAKEWVYLLVDRRGVPTPIGVARY